ncbi:hypothetical protein ACUXJ9_000856 [Staphylococcus caledonicus]
MELISKIITFTMSTFSNWSGSNQLFKDIKDGFKRKRSH